MANKLPRITFDQPAEEVSFVGEWSKAHAENSVTFEMSGVLQKGAPMSSTITVAPWVRDAYAAENAAREKKKLKPLGWTQFCNTLCDDKKRKKMLVAGKAMDAVLKSLG
jgi:hypothetical protein